MTKHQLADIIRERTKLKKKDVLLIIDNLIDVVIKTTEEGDKVDLRGFGTFIKSEKKGRQIFSPIVKKMIDVPPRSTLMFKASKATEKHITGG